MAALMREEQRAKLEPNFRKMLEVHSPEEILAALADAMFGREYVLDDWMSDQQASQQPLSPDILKEVTNERNTLVRLGNKIYKLAGVNR